MVEKVEKSKCNNKKIANREIIGYAAGKNKSADLVKEAIYSIKYPLNKIKIFHTDRGREFIIKVLTKAQTYCT